MRAHLLAGILGLTFQAATAQAADSVVLPSPDSCLPGIMAAERQFSLPPKLLQTIGIVESGRTDPATGRVVPWPWSINVAGTDHVFATKAAAIEAVQAFQQAGTRSIDVGCMQINLMHHPDAFASLDEAFDPAANTRYGARFLSALYQETGNWLQATALYHSRTQDIGASYETRVMAMWPLAGQFPDATLRQRGRAVAAEDDTRRFTPDFAAKVKQMRADLARLADMAGPVDRQPAKRGATEDDRYVPEFAAQLKEMRRSRAGHVESVAANTPARARRTTTSAASGADAAFRDSQRFRLAEGR